ncbi:uncharacterized protein LOC100678991 isoform X2 [Nasonia vitripennis]|uniref:Uncharacterized protein n=1 Tax=Nasonia vitripennis TaxID=7425 RepID=A0A7M7Q9R5_NASVI|nr:uncharacterized protein LOC100678991 isoform X2 [Nasonia vitripennis]
MFRTSGPSGRRDRPVNFKSEEIELIKTRTHRTDFEGNGNSSTSSAHAQPAEDPMALLQRLASAGILQLPSTSVTPAPNVPTSRHKQCINCDRRFDVSRQSKEYQEHLDWHFKENRQRKTAKKNFAGRVGLGSREGRGYHG